MYQFRDKSGYRFECHFSNGQLPDNEYYELFQNIQKTIAIIDLLAISSENKELAKKFDTRMSGAVILPICSELKKKLKKIAEKNRTDLFKFFELSRKKIFSWIMILQMGKTLNLTIYMIFMVEIVVIVTISTES